MLARAPPQREASGGSADARAGGASTGISFSHPPPPLEAGRPGSFQSQGRSRGCVTVSQVSRVSVRLRVAASTAQGGSIGSATAAQQRHSSGTAVLALASEALEPSLTKAAFSGEASLGSVCSARLVCAEL